MPYSFLIALSKSVPSSSQEKNKYISSLLQLLTLDFCFQICKFSLMTSDWDEHYAKLLSAVKFFFSLCNMKKEEIGDICSQSELSLPLFLDGLCKMHVLLCNSPILSRCDGCYIQSWKSARVKGTSVSLPCVALQPAQLGYADLCQWNCGQMSEKKNLFFKKF